MIAVNWMRMKFKITCWALLLYGLANAQAVAGDITPLDGLGLQSYNRVISDRLMSADWQTNFFIEHQNNIQLKPEQNTPTYGNRQLWGLNLTWPGWQHSELSLGLRHSQAQIEGPDINSFDNLPTDQGGQTVSLALRQNLLTNGPLAVSVIPFLEAGYNSKRAFHLPSKSRAGLVLATGWQTQHWGLSTNMYYRYRPAEMYESYRLANDFGFGAALEIPFADFALHTEILENNVFVINNTNRRPAYRRHVSQLHRTSVRAQIEDLSISAFISKALSHKTFGVPGDSLGFAFAWQPGRTAKLPRSSLKRKTPRTSSDDDLKKPLEIDPGLEDNSSQSPLAPKEPEESPESNLRSIERQLHKLQLIDQRAELESPQELERQELVEGDQTIQRLREVDQRLENKQALEKIRQKKHREHTEHNNSKEAVKDTGNDSPQPPKRHSQASDSELTEPLSPSFQKIPNPNP
jgi:hypothetical protein